MESGLQPCSHKAIKASSLRVWNRQSTSDRNFSPANPFKMASFTITEKGYAFHKPDGTSAPISTGWCPEWSGQSPHRCHGSSGEAMLYERYKAGEYPIALVSMDNCSQNGAERRESVLTMTEEWKKAGFVDDGFMSYVSDRERVGCFPMDHDR